MLDSRNISIYEVVTKFELHTWSKNKKRYNQIAHIKVWWLMYKSTSWNAVLYWRTSTSLLKYSNNREMPRKNLPEGGISWWHRFLVYFLSAMAGISISYHTHTHTHKKKFLKNELEICTWPWKEMGFKMVKHTFN